MSIFSYAENMRHVYDDRNYLNINMCLKRVALLTSNGPINETEWLGNGCVCPRNTSLTTTDSPCRNSNLQMSTVCRIMLYVYRMVIILSAHLNCNFLSFTWALSSNVLGFFVIGHISGPPPSPRQVSSPCLPPAQINDLCNLKSGWSVSFLILKKGPRCL